MSDPEITAPWLAKVLKTHVQAVQVTPMGGETGFSGALFRVDPVPASLGAMVVKGPSPIKQLRDVMMQSGFYDREVQFYRYLAKAADVPTPQLLGVDQLPGMPPILVLSHIDDARPGDQARGLTPEAATPIVRLLARLHGRLANHPAAADVPGMAQGADIAAAYAACWPGFQARFGEYLPKWLAEIAPDLGPQMAKLQGELARAPVTVLHGDMRLDNVLFRRDGSPVFLDWQTIVRGRAGYDLAYLSAGNFLHHDQGAIDCLLRAYHAELSEQGWAAYDWQDLRADYRRGIGFLWARTVTAGAQFPFAQGAAHERFRLALERWCDAAECCGIVDDLRRATAV
ncbi:aminoglycoside phosphotransferase family protein [Roseovarius aestuarii]|nr:aminoglycoside phosphotransferase family protein [Roseovarius aestuarii]